MFFFSLSHCNEANPTLCQFHLVNSRLVNFILSCNSNFGKFHFVMQFRLFLCQFHFVNSTFVFNFVNFELATWKIENKLKEVVSSGGAPTPAGTSVFTKHNWDMEMGYLWLNGWGINHLMGGAFMGVMT